MKKALLILALLFALVSSASATDIVVSAQAQPYANISNLGPSRSVTVTVTNGSTTVTSSAAFPPYLNGVTGWKISISGTDYQVSTQASTSSLTLTGAFNGTSGSTTATIYPVVFLKIFVDREFIPLGQTYIVQSGSPASPTGFYKLIGCSYKNNQILIPQITLDSQVDAATAAHRQARMSAFFMRPDNSLISPFQGFTRFQVPSNITPTTWANIATYNAPSAEFTYDSGTYSMGQIDAKINLIQTQLDTINAPVFYVDDYGAVPDGLRATGTISVGSTTLTATTPVFSTSDVNKVIYIVGAGPTQATGAPNGFLKTVITAVSSTTVVTVQTAATATSTGVYFYFGTDNTSAFEDAIDAASAVGGGRVQMSDGQYIITQLTLPAHTILSGTVSSQAADGGADSGGSSVWSVFGLPATSNIEGIIQTRFPINASNDADITLENFNIVALDTYQFQSCFDEVGGTFIHLKKMMFNNCHWGVIWDQSEVSEVIESNFLNQNFAASGGYNGGYTPTEQGWTLTGNGTVNLETGIDQTTCEGCGRWQVYTGISLDSTYYYRTLSSSAFNKGMYILGKYPEVLAGTATILFDNGTYRYSIQFPYNASNTYIKVNGGTSHNEGTLSSQWMLGIMPGGATAKLYIDGVLIETVTASASAALGQNKIIMGDFGTNNSSMYLNIFNYDFSYPRSAADWAVQGDTHWNHRDVATLARGYMRSGSNQLICSPTCNFNSANVGTSFSVAGAGAAGGTFTATATAYAGDEYTWLTATALVGDTTLTVVSTSQFPSSGWLYLGGESVYYTGKTATTFTGVTRGLVGSTAIQHDAGDGHTVSVNHFQTITFGSSASTTVNAASVTYYPAAQIDFTNRITRRYNQYNFTGPQVAIDGGVVHDVSNNNINGGSVQFLFAAPTSVTATNNEHEGMTQHTIRLGGAALQGSTVGRAKNVTIKDSLINLNNEIFGLKAIKIISASGVTLTGNYFPAVTHSVIGTDNTGAMGSVAAIGNTTGGARLFDAPYGAYNYIFADNLGSDVPYPDTGGDFIANLTTNAYRLRSRNLELHYDSRVQESGKTGLGAVNASSTSFTATVSQFVSGDTGKTITITGAGAAGALYTGTVTYVNGTDLTISPAASTTVANATWSLYYNAAEAKSANIRFFDDDDTSFFRIYGQSNFTANRTGLLPNFSGTFALSNGVLGTNYWLFSNSTGQIDGSANATMDSAGSGLLRYLVIKANAGSPAPLLDITDSAATVEWEMQLDSSNRLIWQDVVNNKNLMTFAPGTFPYLQLLSTAGLNFAGSSAVGSSSMGLAKNTNGIEINSGRQTGDTGTRGQFRDATMRKLFLVPDALYNSTQVTVTATSPASARTHTFQDLSGIPVESATQLTAGRVPFGVAIDAGVGVTDSANLTYSSPVLTLTGSDAYVNVSSNAGSGSYLYLTYSGTAAYLQHGASDFGFSTTNTKSFAIKPNGLSALIIDQFGRTTLGYNQTAQTAAELQISPVNSTTIIQVNKAAAGQTADLFQAQNSAAAVLARLDPTGSLFVADGSASLPSISFQNLNTTGFFKPASGIGTTVAGAEKLWISANGVYQPYGGSFAFSSSNSTSAGTTYWKISMDGTGDTAVLAGNVAGGGFIQNTGGESALDANFTRSDTTLTATNISFQVRAGRSYRIRGLLKVTNSVAGEGIKLDFNGGSATVTTFWVAADVNGSVVAGTIDSTSLAGVVNYSTTTGTVYMYLDGYIKVNAAGTLILRAAENSTGGGGTMTLAAGSWLALYDTVNK